MRDRLLAMVVWCGVFVWPVAAQPKEVSTDAPKIEFRVLLIIKVRTEAYSPLFLPIRSEMTESDIAAIRRCFEVETPDMVREITKGRVRFVPTVHISKTPLRRWNPQRLDSAEYDEQELLHEYYSLAKPGDYDSVGYSFLHYDRASGYVAPRAGYGVGGYNREHKIGTFAVHCAGAMNPRDEVFLHEWMHGLDGFYDRKPGVNLPTGYLHGIPKNSIYVEKPFRPGDTFRGWMEWYRDYLNGDIREGTEKRGLGEAAWRHGPMRTAAVANPPRSRPKAPIARPYPQWLLRMMKGDLSQAKLGPSLLTEPLPRGELSKTPWQLSSWNGQPTTIAGVAPKEIIVLQSTTPNNASIHRSVNVRPSCNYLFTAEVKLTNVRITETGGRIGVRVQAAGSASESTLVGNSGWRSISVPFTTSEKGDAVDLRISLGGSGSVATGRVQIRNLQLRQVRYPE